MKKFAVCGVSKRAMGMFIEPMLRKFSKSCQLVGLLDVDPKRFAVCKQQIPATLPVPEFSSNEFDRMVAETKADVVIVASRDDTHVDYILEALERGLDVITEKPMATTAADCQKIMDAEKKSKGNVTVTFNYRYSPYHQK